MFDNPFVNFWGKTIGFAADCNFVCENRTLIILSDIVIVE